MKTFKLLLALVLAQAHGQTQQTSHGIDHGYDCKVVNCSYGGFPAYYYLTFDHEDYRDEQYPSSYFMAIELWIDYLDSQEGPEIEFHDIGLDWYTCDNLDCRSVSDPDWLVYSYINPREEPKQVHQKPMMCIVNNGPLHVCTPGEMMLLLGPKRHKRHHVKHHAPVNQCTITGAIKECAPGGVR